jgi:hypothetical protein
LGALLSTPPRPSMHRHNLETANARAVCGQAPRPGSDGRLRAYRRLAPLARERGMRVARGHPGAGTRARNKGAVGRANRETGFVNVWIALSNCFLLLAPLFGRFSTSCPSPAPYSCCQLAAALPRIRRGRDLLAPIPPTLCAIVVPAPLSPGAGLRWADRCSMPPQIKIRLCLLG